MARGALKRSGWLALGLSLGLLANVALAQGRPAAGGAGAAPPAAPAAPRAHGTMVALVDLGMILKNHPRVKQQVEAMKQELTDYEKEVVSNRQSLSKQRDKMTSFTVGSPEYKQAEEQIARQVSDLQVRDQLKKKEILEREAKIYYDAYQEITREVEKLANEFGIGLVIRFDSQAIDPTDRNSVQAGVNRNVVFQRNLDLTKMVLQRVGGTLETAGEAPRQRTAAGNAGAASGAPKTQRK